ncbi:LytTR family transcriptional regulator DNA-binding domain-containing protein [Lactobacillus delbrueckii subsp. bulgaricus]|nr:LytTR family transcriptional regulator [Lactobacillus delbrueckii subsp. bulgaricus]
MKVKVELNKDQDLPLAVIYTDKMTEEVERAVAFLESSASSGPLIAQQEDRLVIIKPSDVILVRVEGGDTVIYTGKGKYFSRKRLYEVYQQLGQDFMQISKQAVVNLTCLESVEASFNGTMFLRLEHGLSDYIKEAYRITPIKKKPYYGCILGGRILCTFDGLRINTKMEVLDENHDPIPGLYAAGNDAGGFF